MEMKLSGAFAVMEGLSTTCVISAIIALADRRLDEALPSHTACPDCVRYHAQVEGKVIKPK
jgi:hypothetical protein